MIPIYILIVAVVSSTSAQGKMPRGPPPPSSGYPPPPPPPRSGYPPGPPSPHSGSPRMPPPPSGFPAIPPRPPGFPPMPPPPGSAFPGMPPAPPSAAPKKPPPPTVAPTTTPPPTQEELAAERIGADLLVYQNLVKALDENRTVLKITVNELSTFCANPKELPPAEALDGLFTITKIVDEVKCFGNIPHLCFDQDCAEVKNFFKNRRWAEVSLTEFKLSSEGEVGDLEELDLKSGYASYDVVRYDADLNTQYQFALILIDGLFWDTVFVNYMPAECEQEADQTSCWWRVHMARFQAEFDEGRRQIQDLA